jgi:hypothetical protein
MSTQKIFLMLEEVGSNQKMTFRKLNHLHNHQQQKTDTMYS